MKVNYVNLPLSHPVLQFNVSFPEKLMKTVATGGNIFSLRESRAIAQMTARCAQRMGALKKFGSPTVLMATFPRILIGFYSDRAYKCACKI